MKHLRRTIRKILLEEFACASLNDNVGEGIAELERQGFTLVSDWSPEEYDSGVAKSIGLNVYDDLGRQAAYWLGTSKYRGDECLDAFHIVVSIQHSSEY